MRKAYLLLLAALSSCPADPIVAVEDAPVTAAPRPVQYTALAPTRPLQQVDPQPADPYSAWPLWCEGPAVPCTTDAGCPVDRTGRERRCIRPWWSKRERVCAVPYPMPGERRRAEARVRQIVRAQCGRGCDQGALARFVLLVASRESSLRAWKHHRLNPDVAAARTSWARARERYAGRNRFYAERQRWQGWGLLGQQSATFVGVWDVEAPPEVLCREAVAVATYLSVARRAWSKQASLGVRPTWETVHNAVSLGEVVPRKKNESFRARARAVGIDPDERISREGLGMVVGRSPDARNAWLALVEAEVRVPVGDQVE